MRSSISTTRVQRINDVKHPNPRPDYCGRHDILTGLPNHEAFSLRIRGAIEAVTASGGGFTVVCLNLDRFRDINDSFRYTVGDETLKAVADRVSQAVPEYFVARIGADELIMIVPCAISQTILMRDLLALQASVGEEIPIAGLTLRVSISAGVATYPEMWIE